jgi:tetratricopeptide (TPR) repeat protein
MAQMQVFVSHSHEDDAFCRAVVEGLRGAGADVWYDEHNLGSGQLMEVIQRELGRRPVVLLILSKAAFASRWVRREIVWAYELLDRDPSRLLLPVTAGPIARDDFSPEAGWLFLHDFKRIEASGYQPYPTDEAVRRLLHTLALTPAHEAPAPTTPQPSESAADLLERGKALIAQKRYADALPLIERATQLNPSSFDAWFNLGFILNELHRYTSALPAYDRALALDGNSAPAWNNKGNALRDLKRPSEALAASDRALALDPAYAFAWYGKGSALYDLKRPSEALAACDRALALDPADAFAWNGKGNSLYDLKRYAEALEAYDRGFDRNDPRDWRNKGNTLYALKRYAESLSVYEQSLSLEPESVRGWNGKALALRGLGRTAEAEAAERRAKELGG